MPERLLLLLEAAAGDPGLCLSALPITLPGETAALRQLGQGPVMPLPATDNLYALFAARTAAHPERTALQQGDWCCSYGELDQHSAALAARLDAAGVSAGDRVGVSLARGRQVPAALLAILRLGAIYVPLDPEYPAARLAQIADDADLSCILADTTGQASLPADRPCIDPAELAAAGDATALESRAHVDACLLYTSGSTGKPKGVPLSHRSAVNRLQWMWERYEFSPQDVFALRTSLNFIDSVWELFGALGSGARLLLPTDTQVRDAEALIDAVADATHLVFVPALLRQVLKHCPDLGARLPALRSCICSGEALPPDLPARFRRAAPGVRLLNTYGTSEVWDVTWAEVQDHENGRVVPVGRPVANVQVHVLDAHDRPVPVGVAGELCVTGAGVGAGYWRQPALTAIAYGTDPGDPSRPLYRTGDLARWRADGQLECLGRRDHQIKLRGHRIEAR